MKLNVLNKKTDNRKYNHYDKIFKGEKMIIIQSFSSDPDFKSEDPYKVKYVAAFRRIIPKKGMTLRDFKKSDIVLYSSDESDRVAYPHFINNSK